MKAYENKIIDTKDKTETEELIYFLIVNNGERLRGFITPKEIQYGLRNYNSGNNINNTVQYIYNNYEIRVYWKEIKDAIKIQNYIKEFLPEYLI